MKYNILTTNDMSNHLVTLPGALSVVQPVSDAAPVPPQPWVQLSEAEFQTYVATNNSNLRAHILATAPSIIIQRARIAAISLMDNFAGSNVAAGITQAGKTKLIADALSDVQRYLATGSLYEAINALDAVVITGDMAPYLTEAIRASYKTAILAILASL